MEAKGRDLFFGLLALVADENWFFMTVTLDPFIHIEESNGCGEFPKFAKHVVARVKLWGLLSDITANNA